MPPKFRIPSATALRLAVITALLSLACQEAPPGGNGALQREPLAPQALPLAATGEWSTTGTLISNRFNHTATLLPSGKVLVTGGVRVREPLDTAEVYDPATALWGSTSAMSTTRRDHTATLLPSGQVLVAGGTSVSGVLSSAELYEPTRGTWSTTGSLATFRRSHTATLLLSGKVLVTGGRESNDVLSTAEVYDPATGTWSPTGALTQAREHHTATLLPSGKVLVTGGSGPQGALANSEVYDPATGTWSPTGTLAQARDYPTATVLPSGKVLLAGGSTSSAELYDPSTGTWSPTGALAEARGRHSATLLPSGKVLVAGGYSSSATLSSAELYDPATGQWTSAGALAQARGDHTATLLPSGKVLVSGSISSNALSAELYEPKAGTWRFAGVLTEGRHSHTATLLPSGKVLISGGEGSVYRSLNSAELYDPATGTWSSTGALAQAREFHTATLLPSGKVLVTGGYASGTLLSSAELYDPATGTWSPAGALTTRRYLHTATLLPSGKVLITGGDGSNGHLSSTELYDPATGTWSSTGALTAGRGRHTATMLSSGKVLVTGGVGSGAVLASAELYDPVLGTWSPTGALAGARANHAAALLPSGKVLAAGGMDSSGLLSSAEVYDPATETWSPAGALAWAREHPTATLLPSGKVLVAGGGDSRGMPVSSAELYDPGARTWSLEAGTARTHHVATLLPSGQVLMTGGIGFGPYTNLASAEEYEGTGASPERRPLITAPAEQQPGELLSITGSRLRGISEASSGTTQSSAANLPLVSLVAIDSGALTRALSWSLLSSTEVTVRAPLVPDGYYILSVMTQGVPGGRVVLMKGPALTAPRFTSPSALVNSAQPVLGGTARPGSTVRVQVDGTLVGTPQANAQGSWTLTLGTALAEGLHRAIATATDAVGNVSSPSEEHLFTVDTVPPAAPVVSGPEAFVKTSTPVLTGTAEARSVVQVAWGDDASQRGTVEADAAGQWRLVLSTALPDKLYQAKATARDAAGNVSALSAVHLFTVDTVPPEPPEVTAPGAFVPELTPVIAGTAEAGSTVTVFLDGEVVGPAVVDATGAWSIALAVELREDTHWAEAQAQDTAGNVSESSAAYPFTVDITPPAPPEVTAPGASINTRTPVIQGKAEPGSTVAVWLEDEEASAEVVTVSTEGDWRFTPPTALEFGPHSVTVRAIDAAGNRSDTSTHPFTFLKSHYGWGGCTTTSGFPAVWGLVALVLSLRRRARRGCE